MRVFVCEFVTAGGLRDAPLPETLVPEGMRMRDAICADLALLPGVREVLTAHDDRLPAPSDAAIPVPEGADPWAIWSTLAAQADVVWPVAPETGGLLAAMIRRLGRGGARLIASDVEAVETCSSKSATARRLAVAGLPHIPTFAAAAAPDDLPWPRLTKPDDGAGCENTRLWPAGSRPPAAPGLIVQPYVAGIPASLSVLVRPDGARLLAANRQHVAVADGALSLTGLTVGGLPDPDGALARLAQDVAAAFPGLAGIIGIDIVLTPAGPVVVEVNPRVTTAYAGLHAALGVNPAAFLPELIRAGTPPALPHLPPATQVEIALR
ncbi:ATP-grasp domain-containing protein [Xanthobacter tagetidis]|uniref:ATP-grasp domain-containing protein n=1 Tax=Xanthobacter tagetidis TaxID=60216 RepID=A0A3L7A5J3_9HYPH|nr:ATP-grasp domain-containing protein [Xanthobacter tagetidis]MBB6308787.1 putative ATP-grasp superfamily ATP-dependent carboligase [Xanthobacter tagetidis]RLP74841.1 ATP-grasp domain-containing protein [Xanthobacter tagetidis]